MSAWLEPPSPATAKRGRYATGHWRHVRSPRVPNRRLQFFTELEFRHYLLVESDPGVDTFCEWPTTGSVGQPRHQNPFHMWVRWSGGGQELRQLADTVTAQEFRGDPERHPKLAESMGWCARNGIRYRLFSEAQIDEHGILITNMARLLRWLHDTTWIDQNMLPAAVHEAVPPRGEISLERIQQAFSDVEPGEVTRATYALVYRGDLESDLRHRPISSGSMFWRQGAACLSPDA